MFVQDIQLLRSLFIIDHINLFPTFREIFINQLNQKIVFGVKVIVKFYCNLGSELIGDCR